MSTTACATKAGQVATQGGVLEHTPANIMTQWSWYLNICPPLVHIWREEIWISALNAHVSIAIHKQVVCHHIERIAFWGSACLATSKAIGVATKAHKRVCLQHAWLIGMG